MKKNYQKCLETILHHEGGYVNHPKDPGGETNLGVTKRVYEEHGGTKDMKELTVEDVAPIYKKGYWDKMKCDDLPSGLDLCVFDFGVNAGPGRAAKYLQTLIGTKADGGIGPMTLAKVEEYINTHNVNDPVSFDYITYKPESTLLEESQQLEFAVGIARHGFKVTIKERQ